MKLPLLAKLFISLTLLFIFQANSVFAADDANVFNHDETTFPLDFTHALVNCESCHVQGIFAGTPTQCSGCHSSAGRIQASAPSVQHILTTNDVNFAIARVEPGRMCRESIILRYG